MDFAFKHINLNLNLNIAAAGPELSFPPIPSFSPELFAYLRCAPNQKKAFAKGVEGLLGEGAVQVGGLVLGFWVVRGLVMGF